MNAATIARLSWRPGSVVGFVIGGFDPENEIGAFRAGIWRLNITADEQGKGYGRSPSRRPPPRRDDDAVTSASPSCGFKVMAVLRSVVAAR